MRDAGGGRLTAALMLLVAFVIGGCDDSGPGSPAAPTSEPGMGGDPMPTSTAPRVTGPTPPQEPLPGPPRSPEPSEPDTAVPPPIPDQETTEPGSDEGNGA